MDPEAPSELRLRLAQQAAGLGYWDFDPATQRVIWDETCAAIFGTTVAEFEGSLQGFDARCHPADLDRVHEVLLGTAPGAPMEVTYRAVLPDGSERHVLSRGQALAGPDGRIERIVGVVLDVTSVHAADRKQREAAERLASLATVALAMSQAHDPDDLTRLVIEHGAKVLGADGGAVCIRDDARGTIRLNMTESLGEEVQLEYGELPLDGPLPGSWTARTGESVFLPDRAAGLRFTPEMQIVYDGTGREAWAVLPLRGADRLLGSLVVSWAEAREFAPEERELLAAFAAQTAQALERIQSLQAERRLAREGRRLAETLQRSLLTPPPQPAGAQLAVRYDAAAEAAAIGGDWYDGFFTAEGWLTLVIGDCVGHDRQAAASMATMRNLLRATAYAIGEPPAAVLAALERALRGLEVDVLATALLAQLKQTPEQESRGDFQLSWSNAGHLPPVLRTPDGKTRLLTNEPDLLLGLSLSTDRGDSTVLLPKGSTVLLYTDGLVERRDEDLDVGIERLRSLLEDLGELPLEQLCDAILERMSNGISEDDVALLALRTEPLDGAVPTRGTGAELELAGLSATVRSVGLPGEPRSAREARDFVAKTLASEGLSRWADAACLAVSEIVTNAVLHAHTDLILTVQTDAGGVRVEVRDYSTAMPAQRHYDTSATTGRGMQLVAAMTSGLGVRAIPNGKVVWFTVDDTTEGGTSDWVEDTAARPRRGDRTVLLEGLPTTLWLAAQRHHDTLLREIALHRAGAGQSTHDLARADRARNLVSEQVEEAVAEARRQGTAIRPLPEHHPAPLPEVPPVLDLRLSLDHDALGDFPVLQDVLDEAERLAARAALLARPGLPEIVAVRDWVCEQVVAQVNGTPPSPWPGTDAERFAARSPEDGLDHDVRLLAEVRDADVGMILADDGNRILAVSRPLADALQWDRDELLGRRIVAIVPHRFREAHVAGFTRHLATGEAHALGVELQLPVLRKDGTELTCTFLIEAQGTPTGRTLYRARITPEA